MFVSKKNFINHIVNPISSLAVMKWAAGAER